MNCFKNLKKIFESNTQNVAKEIPKFIHEENVTRFNEWIP